MLSSTAFVNHFVSETFASVARPMNVQSQLNHTHCSRSHRKTRRLGARTLIKKEKKNQQKKIRKNFITFLQERHTEPGSETTVVSEREKARRQLHTETGETRWPTNRPIEKPVAYVRRRVAVVRVRDDGAPPDGTDIYDCPPPERRISLIVRRGRPIFS